MYQDKMPRVQNDSDATRAMWGAPIEPKEKRLVVRLNLAKNPFAMTDAGQVWLLGQLTDKNKKHLESGGSVLLWGMGLCWYATDWMVDPLESREFQDKLTRKIRGRSEWREAV